jgi:hypothetical protein
MEAMPKSNRDKEQEPESEEAIMERVTEGFKRLLNTPPETHKEMVGRRRGRAPEDRQKKSRQRT